MQTKIVGKNSRIAQLETTNTRLYTLNDRLTDLCFGGKLVEKDIETGIEEEDEGRGGETEIEERKENELKNIESVNSWLYYSRRLNIIYKV